MHVFNLHWCTVRYWWNTGGSDAILFFCYNKPIQSWSCRCAFFLGTL